MYLSRTEADFLRLGPLLIFKLEMLVTKMHAYIVLQVEVIVMAWSLQKHFSKKPLDP